MEKIYIGEERAFITEEFKLIKAERMQDIGKSWQRNNYYCDFKIAQ